jgi:hypothetical protein
VETKKRFVLDLSPPKGDGSLPQPPTAAPPSTPYLHRCRRQRSSGEARAMPMVAAFHSPRHGEWVMAFPIPGGSSTWAAAVQRGGVAVARWCRVAER